MANAISKAKEDLIQNVVFGISKNGAFQRNSIYCEKLNSKDASDFKIYLKAKLIKTLQEIIQSKQYEDKDHYATILKFSKEVSKDYKHCLKDEVLNIGTTQKLINLFWKMSWLLQKGIPEPVHCPFDGIIIKRLSKNVRDVKWTSMSSIKDYKELVSAVRAIAGESTIARWELVNYNIGNKIS